MHSLLPLFRWAEATWLGEIIRSQRAYFPIIETIHLLALTVLFGALIMLNLRLCGLIMKELPINQVAQDLSSWLIWSLVIILVSGLALFSSEALKCFASKSFQLKMLFLFAALVFHFTVYRKVTKSNSEPTRIWGVAVAVFSAVLWLGVGLGGRGIGFVFL
jgi:uncharacterized protein DUF6644